MAEQNPVWFITGCSTGFGREIAKLLLSQGIRVAMTARKLESIADLVEGNEKIALPLALDVTDRAQIDAAVTKAEEHFGQIDVLVNNAGYGYFAAIEEGEEDEIRRQFDTNVFGLAALTRRVLPGMRKRRSGHIFNFSSIGGLTSHPSLGYYCATKFAVEAISEALSKEVAPLGIKVTLIEPSGFRTDWAGRSSVDPKVTIDDYAETAGYVRSLQHDNSGNQPGDPERLAKAIVDVSRNDNPPLRLLMGSYAYNLAMERVEELRQTFKEWKEVTCGVDFPDAELSDM